MSEELEPISPDEARTLLEDAIRERLGDHWEGEEFGWVRVTGHDYMARLTRRGKNLDFYVDLLGNVTVEEKPINEAQSSGRLIAWVLLLLSLGIAILIARIVGGL
ncbi:MAG: hypothetical protein H6672_12095 [Anaerolineaceae bacterium]|nr:hypothetical protein [Anaerolineaceae bacterium]